MDQIKFKTCKQCGEIRPIAAFRSYYGNRKGTYRYCKTCEKILTRRKYLVAKGDRKTEEEIVELAKIDKLYELRANLGYEVPGRNKDHGGATELLDGLIAKAEQQNENM